MDYYYLKNLYLFLGTIQFDDCQFHVILGMTHNFDKTILDTVIIENINPIEKLEQSSLIVASTIHQLNQNEILKEYI